MEIKYKRVLLKISGEALAGGDSRGIDFNMLDNVCENIAKCVRLGVQIGIVVGGGNFWRGRSGGKMDRTRADHMGMLATAMNALAIQDMLEQKGIPTRVQTAIEMRQIAEPYIRNRAVTHLNKGRVVIFGCGTGNPFFTTDTAASLRAVETEADIILLAKNVDAVYSADPQTDKTAVKYDELSYIDVINKGLGVMDSTAASLCMDNDIPILVFELGNGENIIRAVMGEILGTIVNKGKGQK